MINRYNASQLIPGRKPRAELAYLFATGAIEQAPQLTRVIDEEIERWKAPSLPGRPNLEIWGVLDAPMRQAVYQSGFDNAVRPLVSQLIARAS